MDVPERSRDAQLAGDVVADLPIDAVVLNVVGGLYISLDGPGDCLDWHRIDGREQKIGRLPENVVLQIARSSQKVERAGIGRDGAQLLIKVPFGIVHDRYVDGDRMGVVLIVEGLLLAKRGDARDFDAGQGPHGLERGAVVGQPGGRGR